MRKHKNKNEDIIIVLLEFANRRMIDEKMVFSYQEFKDELIKNGFSDSAINFAEEYLKRNFKTVKVNDNYQYLINIETYVDLLHYRNFVGTEKVLRVSKRALIVSIIALIITLLFSIKYTEKKISSFLDNELSEREANSFINNLLKENDKSPIIYSDSIIMSKWIGLIKNSDNEMIGETILLHKNEKIFATFIFHKTIEGIWIIDRVNFSNKNSSDIITKEIFQKVE
jgi:hypothetical protein